MQISFLGGTNLFLGDYVFFDMGPFPMRTKNSSMLVFLFYGIQVSLLVCRSLLWYAGLFSSDAVFFFSTLIFFFMVELATIPDAHKEFLNVCVSLLWYSGLSFVLQVSFLVCRSLFLWACIF